MKVKIDTTPPGADDLSDTSGTTGDPISFSATLTDTHAGVSGAKVNWRYAGGTSFTVSNMTEVSGSPGEYEWTLDAPENSTAGVEYYITVYDLAVPSNEGRLPADGESTILITDDDAPVMAQVTGDGTGTTGEPFTVNVIAFDNIIPISSRIYLDGIITGIEMTASGGSGNVASYTTDVAIAQDSVDARTYHVVVRDEAGNELRLPETEGADYTITVVDNDPPVFDPEESSASAYAAPDDPMRLFALAEDNIGLAAITAVVDSGSGGGSTMDMEEGSGDIFEAFITASESFGFHFEAADAAGNVALLPAEGSFTITVPLMTLTQPAEGETVSDIVEVVWTVEGIDPDEDEAAYSLQLSSDGGGSWEELKGSVSLSKGATNDAGVPAGTWDWSTYEYDDSEYIIRVIGSFGESPDDIEVSSMSGTFTLDNMDPPALVVDEPREGGKYSGTIEIEYTATDPDPGDTLTVDMEYMLEGGGWTDLLTDGENTGGFTWKTRTEMGALEDGMYHLRVTVTDDSDRALIAVVEVGPFRIRNQDPPELSFDGGGDDELGDEYVIQWTAEDPEGDEVDIDLYYSKDGGDWVTIAEDEENDGSYTWDTSGLEPGTYRLKLVATDTSDRDTELETPGLTKTAVAGEDKESEGSDDNSMTLLLLVIAVIAIAAIAGAMSGAKKKRLAREKAEKEEAGRKAEEERLAAEAAAAEAAAAQAAATTQLGMPPEHLVGPYGAAGPEHTLGPTQYAPPEPPPVPDMGMQPPLVTAPDAGMQPPLVTAPDDGMQQSQMTAPDDGMPPAMTPSDQGAQPPAMEPPEQGAQPPAMEPPEQGAQPPAMEPPEPGADDGGGIKTGSGALSAAESSLFDDV
jgi:3D (Asp-Asp-Asp) domain-containing protein